MLKTNLSIKPQENLDFINSVRSLSNSSYQERVPMATKANLHETMSKILDFTPNYNDFVDVLVNQIALIEVRNQIWNNPLTEFKSGIIEFGDTVEEIQVGLIKAYAYNGNEDTTEQQLLGRNVPDVQANFHQRNRQDVYKVTINEDELKMAFQQSQGLSKFTSALVSSLSTSDQFDEFLIMKNLITEFDAKNGFYTVKVPDVANDSSTERDAKVALRKIKSIFGKMQFPNTLYNAAGMPTWLEPEKAVLITTPSFMAAIDVEALAVLFNMSKAEIPTRIVLVDDLPIKGFQALLTTADWWKVYDTLIRTTTFVNPAAPYTQMWLTHWGIYSASRFVPAVLLSSERETALVSNETEPTALSDITVTDSSGNLVTVPAPLTRGAFYIANSVATTTPVGGTNTGVEYELTGNLKPMSFVDNSGVLHIHISDPTVSVTVTATTIAIDVDDPTGTAPLVKSRTFTVNGPLESQWPVPDSTP